MAVLFALMYVMFSCFCHFSILCFRVNCRTYVMFLFVIVPCVGQQYVIVAFPGYTHLLCLIPVLLNFWVTIKAAPHECVIRTGILKT